MKIPLKVLIVASHRTGSSLLGDILSYSRQGYINRYKNIVSGHKNSLYAFSKKGLPIKQQLRIDTPQTLLDVGEFCLSHKIYSCHLVYQYYYTCLYSLDSRNSSYFFEPMRDAERGFNMSFPHWLPWSSNQIQIGFSTLDKLFSCQYVSKL